MVATRRLTQLVDSALPKLDLPEDRLMVALSGGADSAALAYLAAESGRDIGLVHVDHQLQASPTMARAAHDIGQVFDIPVQTLTVQVGSGPSLEDRAREARYQVLEEIESAVVTGHTRDDSVETMLINLIRGTGLRGLTGIPRFRPPNIHRPMLSIARSETREIATLAGLPFIDDPMNADMSLTRNRIRLHILPLMRELNPQIDSALARTAEMLERDATYLDDVALPYQTEVLPTSVICTLPRVLADRVLHHALEEAGIDPSADRIARMWTVVSGESAQQDLAEGRVVVRRGPLIVVE
ncbi:MAG TPA: tRNA lysidine(34) synthetase TilS [Acidimicrobiia bacterium]